ncbi:MAG: hypothetical protein ACHP6H_03435, partial [Legionellales bacterium]
IKSETQVKDYALQKDLVSAYANADVKVIEDLEKGWYKDPSSGDCYKIKIKAEVTPDEKAMEKLSQATAGTTDQGNINFPVAPPPVDGVGPSLPQGVAAAPDVVVVPSGETYVYMVPNTTGVYFYGGSWYRYYEGYWFRSPVYAGNWSMVAPTVVPRVVVNVPPEYPRYLPPTYYRIHYNDLHQHWQEWDRNHEWHNRDWYKAEMKPAVIGQRQALIIQEREQHRVKMERMHQEAKQQFQQQEQHRIEMERDRQREKQQFRQQEQHRAEMERDRQREKQQLRQQEQHRVEMEHKRQIARQRSQRDNKTNHPGEGKGKKKKGKPKQQKQERHE